VNDLAEWIRCLADDDARVREEAATALYERGAGLAERATRSWTGDQELSQLFTGPLTVGLAVTPASFERIREVNGRPRLAEVPPDQDAAEFELEFPAGARLDILTTRQPEASGAIARFLARHGEAIQQVELPVADIDRATEILRRRFALVPVYPATRPGADRTRVNFFLVTTAEGEKLLLELVEAPAGQAPQPATASGTRPKRRSRP
jgi:hypothetical protein